MTDLCPHCRGADDDCETCGGRGRLCPCGDALATAEAAYCPTCEDLKAQAEARVAVRQQRMLN